MAAIPEDVRQGVIASLPEVNLIQDARLRDGVIDAWALCLSQSSFWRIEEIPASGNPDSPPMRRGTQADHIRGVTRIALGILDGMEAVLGPLEVDRDLLVAAALCHDVGKPYEFDPDNQARWKANPAAAGHPSIRHSVYGVHIALTVGLPEEVAHVAGAHSAEGQFVTRSLVNTIVHHADYAFWDMLRRAGLLQDAQA
jgi:putative nucleotidyltransferase with HDIG domain